MALLKATDNFHVPYFNGLFPSYLTSQPHLTQNCSSLLLEAISSFIPCHSFLLHDWADDSGALADPFCSVQLLHISILCSWLSSLLYTVFQGTLSDHSALRSVAPQPRPPYSATPDFQMPTLNCQLLTPLGHRQPCPTPHAHNRTLHSPPNLFLP